MDQGVTVAVVRSDRRRGAVAEALALLAPDLRRAVQGQVVIKPNLVSHQAGLPSTHLDTFSATLDALLSQGARAVLVAEGATDASAGFDRFGFRREAYERPVQFFDINREETAWEPLELTSVQGQAVQARVSRTMARAGCRVSLAVAKTHVTAMLTLSIKNMLSCLHPADRVMMHGYAGGGNGYAGWRRLVVELLKQDHVAITALTRLIGRVKNLRSRLSGKHGPGGWRWLSRADLAFLRSVEAMNRNLVALLARVRPHVSVVDGFVAMHREGPRHGTPIKLGTIIAGTDPVAVDAVAAAVMGFDPRDVGYLQYAQEAGLGVADLDAIHIVGDRLEAVRRRCVPHSNYEVQRHWRRLADLGGPGQSVETPLWAGPHVMTSRHEEISKR